jgi:DNA polymerase
VTNVVRIQRTFESWRDAARKLLALNVPPEAVAWIDDDTPSLLPSVDLSDAESPRALQVPAEFVNLARLVGCFRDPARWSLLYRMLWRLTHGEKRLLQDVTDDDTHEFFAMHRKVRHDRHKMTAFVRFRAVQSDNETNPHYVAWHRPDHFIVRLTAPFFQRRFASMKWTILTPDESVSWDGNDLCFSAGVPASQAPAGDNLETLWRTYYANIFNPARLNLKMMRREMPVRHWATLPETEMIDDLIREAPKRVEEMVKKQATTCKSTGSAADFLPPRISLPQMREAVQSCRGCDLYCNATQAVFGEGPKGASIMFVGEQPGDQEDLAGKPFVGPAGKLLDDVMDEVGIPRDEVYVTNAVKHFKFEPRGTRRIHAKPNAREMAACKPWLESEIAVIKPEIVVCLGSTAAQQLLGRQFRVTKSRGEWLKADFAPRVMATVHPSALLRMPDHDARVEARKMFTHDLNLVARELRKMKASA